MPRLHWLMPLGALLAACTLASMSGPGAQGGAQGGAAGSTPGPRERPRGARAGASGKLSAECSADMGASAAAQTLETFLSSTAKFAGTAAELEGSLTDTCRQMGKHLGLKEADYRASSQDEPEVRSVCNAVSANLRSELSDLRASAELRVDVTATPPVCKVDMDAYARCAADCQVDVKPGQVKLDCEGGDIVGRCDGECRGACDVEVHGHCSGACEGSCSGGCSGTCHGTCHGTCSAHAANGECDGKCEGTCEGTCSAECKGSCEGTCSMSGEASCHGECHGGCSVAYKEPHCTGTIRPPKMSADCKASCDTRLHAEAHCKPGHAKVVVKGKVDSNLKPRLARVEKAIAAGYASLLSIRAKLQLLERSGSAMVRVAEDVPRAVEGLGLSAAACALEAAAAIPRAAAQVSVSLDVSVSVSAAVSGSAG